MKVNGHMTDVIQSRLIEIVLAFGTRSYNDADWEKMIGKSNLPPHGCIMDAIEMFLNGDARKAAAYRAAQQLRSLYPAYTKSPTAWRDKHWTNQDALQIAMAVCNVLWQVDEASARVETEPMLPPLSRGEQGRRTGMSFVPWQPFRTRICTSDSPGVYLIGFFAIQPPDFPDPLGEEVIYIGIAEAQSIHARLDQFEATALGNTGHSGGFTYRTEFGAEVFHNDWRKLRHFVDTYCSWMVVPTGSQVTPREIEARLLQEYRLRWGAWPRLNKKG